jgi:YebC/PmpR family DNA-binding regulatory protein
MAGHSKWANIKHRKAAQDAKRSKAFTKLIKEITVATKESGADPEMNPRLRLAIQNAKGANMPKDTIERAIQKGAGGDGDAFQDIVYEGYAPNGIAVYVECSTDNTNRSVANVRSIFNKNEGSLAKNGSLEFLFDRKGVFNFAMPEGVDEDEFSLEVIDAGAEDIDFNEGQAQVTCAMEDFGSVSKKLDELKVEIESAGLERIPHNTKALNDEEFKQVMRVIDALEDDDDVQKVYHNLEIQEHQFELMG